MPRSQRAAWLLTFLAAAFSAGAAHGSILGHWTLEMSGTLEGEELPCTFSGTADVGPGSETLQFAGPCHMELVSGPAACPKTMDGQMSVSVQLGPDSITVDGTINGGDSFGLSSFTGVVVGDPTASGTFAVTSGPFTGLGGTWSGSLAVSVVAIPTLRATGLVMLAALLALISAIVLRRRRA